MEIKKKKKKKKKMMKMNTKKLIQLKKLFLKLIKKIIKLI